MNVWRAFRGPVLLSGSITAVILIASVVLPMVTTDSATSGEDLSPLSPSGIEQLVALGWVPFVFLVVFAIVLIAGLLRGTKRSAT